MSINTVIHCPLMRHTTIKEKATEVKGTHKYSTKHHSPACFSLKSFSLIDLSIEGGLANTTPTCYSSTQFILHVFPPTETTPITTLSIRYDEELNCSFFASSIVLRSKFRHMLVVIGLLFYVCSYEFGGC